MSLSSTGSNPVNLLQLEVGAGSMSLFGGLLITKIKMPHTNRVGIPKLAIQPNRRGVRLPLLPYVVLPQIALHVTTVPIPHRLRNSSDKRRKGALQSIYCSTTKHPVVLRNEGDDDSSKSLLLPRVLLCFLAIPSSTPPLHPLPKTDVFPHSLLLLIFSPHSR